jgi:ammonia channel protein AmtB
MLELFGAVLVMFILATVVLFPFAAYMVWAGRHD